MMPVRNQQNPRHMSRDPFRESLGKRTHRPTGNLSNLITGTAALEGAGRDGGSVPMGQC
jgi:hypothetical protein